MEILKRTNKLYDTSKFEQAQIRVWHRKEKKLKGGGIKSACYHLKCGCCNSTVDIWYGGGGIEINGVNGTIEDWREILLPLLDPKNNKKDNWWRNKK
jgi:hypothetical protein